MSGDSQRVPPFAFKDEDNGEDDPMCSRVWEDIPEKGIGRQPEDDPMSPRSLEEVSEKDKREQEFQ
jgi:hypothetical protein